ncbi:MAG: Rrf2 family transcriptional regulator [Ignavibacteriaceae bacterium]|nr:Rrf2 family transcriptional regulator [Ignavibacteriaceae bacterium]
MSASTKLSTAVRALCFLAEHHPDPQTSADISKFSEINASKIRQILSMLVKGGIVKSSYGKKGGFMLNKEPAKLHLQEVYCAIEDRKAFYLNVSKSTAQIKPKLNSLNNYFLNFFADIQIDIEEKMKKITLEQILLHLKQ